MKKKRDLTAPILIGVSFSIIIFVFYWYSDYRMDKIVVPTENSVILDNDKRVADLDFLRGEYERINANYVVDKNEMDTNFVYKNSKEKITEGKEQVNFFSGIRNMRFEDFSYNSIVTPFAFLNGLKIDPSENAKGAIENYKKALENANFTIKPQDYILASDNEVVDKNISFATYLKSFNVTTGIESLPTMKMSPEVTSQNIEEMKSKGVQYIRVPYFTEDNQVIVGNSTQIAPYQDIVSGLKDKKGLIIDLRNNSMGDSSSFRNNFLKKIASKDIALEEYVATLGNNDNFFDNMLAKATQKDITALVDTGLYKPSLSDLKIEKVNELPKTMQNVDKEHLKSLKNFYKLTDNIKKEGEGFNGKIIVIIDNRTFGEAEHIAKLLSKLDNVTIMGQQSKGEGVARNIGLQKVVLPNSKLLFRMQTLYGFNDDGSSNYLKGLLPKKILGYTSTLDTVIEEISKP